MRGRQQEVEENRLHNGAHRFTIAPGRLVGLCLRVGRARREGRGAARRGSAVIPDEKERTPCCAKQHIDLLFVSRVGVFM